MTLTTKKWAGTASFGKSLPRSFEASPRVLAPTQFRKNLAAEIICKPGCKRKAAAPVPAGQPNSNTPNQGIASPCG